MSHQSQDLAFSAAILLRRFASPGGIHLPPRGEALSARFGCGEFPLSLTERLPEAEKVPA